MFIIENSDGSIHPCLLENISDFYDGNIMVSSNYRGDIEKGIYEIRYGTIIPNNDPEKRIVQKDPIKNGDHYLIEYELVDLTDEEKAERIANQWSEIRRIRNDYLNSCDYLIIKYTEAGQEIPNDLKIYRQALRDITKQSDPFNIEWPIL